MAINVCADEKETITPPPYTLQIEENGDYSVNSYDRVDVNVSGEVPTGTILITENGEYDVSAYAKANINVSGGGDVTMKLVDGSLYNIKQSAKEIILGENVISLQNVPLQNASHLEEADLYYSNITSIARDDFYGVSSLKNIYLPHGIERIDSKAFEGVTHAFNIYCPFEKGEISYAPWGATNATIIYDYKR